MAVTANDVSYLSESSLSKPGLPLVAALKIDLVYLCQEGSREQVVLDVLLVFGLLELLAQSKSAIKIHKWWTDTLHVSNNVL